ncbi:MAG: hypothetical protein MI754_11860 [Chromatiales bacterium]|nr:hypothetical protein [Chromatiales bacterium]
MNERLKSYLHTLESNFYPNTILGRYIRSAKNTGSKVYDEIFDRLAEKYATVTQKEPYNFTRALEAPIDIYSAMPAVYAWRYDKSVVDSRGNTKKITITTPGKWILSYEGFDPATFSEQLTNREKVTGRELKDYVIHYLIMAEIIATRLDLVSLLNDLRFSTSLITLDNFGDVPFVIMESDIKTFLPADDVVIEITEISGSDNFEELVDVRQLQNLTDNFLENVKEKLQKNGIDGAME